MSFLIGKTTSTQKFFPIVATGGVETITTRNVNGQNIPWKIHVFYQTSSFNVRSLGSDGLVQYLLVGAGGAGGSGLTGSNWASGGGGGAGGVSTNFLLGPGFAIPGVGTSTVGVGVSSTGSGGNSNWFGWVAFGGGRGGNGNANGIAGGSGGGAGGLPPTAPTGSFRSGGAAVIVSHGNAGGINTVIGNRSGAGGGGRNSSVAPNNHLGGSGQSFLFVDATGFAANPVVAKGGNGGFSNTLADGEPNDPLNIGWGGNGAAATAVATGSPSLGTNGIVVIRYPLGFSFWFNNPL